MTPDAQAEVGCRHISVLGRALRSISRTKQLALHGVTLVLCKSTTASMRQRDNELVLSLPVSVREQVYELELRTVDVDSVRQTSSATSTRADRVDKCKAQLSSALNVSQVCIGQNVCEAQLNRLVADAKHLKERFAQMRPSEALQLPVTVHAGQDVAWARPLACTRTEDGKPVVGFSLSLRAVVVTQACRAKTLLRFLVKEQDALKRLRVRESCNMERIERLRRGIERATGGRVSWEPLLSEKELERELRSIWATATSMQNVDPSARAKAQLRGREIRVVQGDASAGAQLAADGSLRIPMGSYAEGFGLLIRWLASLRGKDKWSSSKPRDRSAVSRRAQ